MRLFIQNSTYRSTRFLRRTPRPLALAAFGLTVLFAGGCGKEQPDSYPLAGKDGAPISPAEAKAIADANNPAAKKAPLTPEEIKAKVDKTEKDLKIKRDMPTEIEVGIPFYPGAQPRKNKGDLALTTESENALLLTLETADSTAKVDAFYKEKLPLAHRLQDTIAGKPTIGYIDDSDPTRKRSIDISAEGAKTVIALISTRVAKAAGMPASASPAISAPAVK